MAFLFDMFNRRSLDMAQMTDTGKSDVIEWSALLLRAARERFGRCAQLWSSPSTTEQDTAQFLKLLFADAKNVNPREPEEINRTTVDVNEKICCNYGGSEDETTVKIVNCVENTEGHSYTQTTTKGVDWGLDNKIGLQFGLQHVEALPWRTGANYIASAIAKKARSNRVEQQSHHEETMRVPPGKKAIVKMTSYRVRYKLEYTMEYKIAQTAHIRVWVQPFCMPSSFGLCGITLFQFCISLRPIPARDLLQYLPGFREDEEFVYFTQDGELRWTAERMEVDKEIAPL